MNEMQKLASWCLEIISKHPQHVKEINGFFKLCQDEILAGESMTNEVELCRGSINELINE